MFVENLTKPLFSHLFVRESQSVSDNKKGEKETQTKPRVLGISIKIIEAQLLELNQIKNSNLEYVRNKASEIITLLT